MAKRAEPPKLILISVEWVWTPMKRKIMNKGIAPLFMLSLNNATQQRKQPPFKIPLFML